jgi:hypothetical protein
MTKSFWIATTIFFVALAGVQGHSVAQVAESVQAGRPAKTGEPRLEVQAGVAASVKGAVKATTPPEKRAHRLKDGDPIFMGDKIETEEDGQLQIQLLDQTVFSLGPLSTIMVDEFLYDPQSAGAKGNMVKGIFRAVSGKVAQKKSEDVEEIDAFEAVKAAPETSPVQARDEAEALQKLMDEADATHVGSQAPEKKKLPA